MPVFNYPKKEVNVKVVYYGPGLSGKTTNLQKIHDGIKPDFRGKLVSLATQTDRTLFFDFMPMELGSLGGYKVRLHLYTVPGQVHYNATRKLVLKGVDGVVFVADSQRAMNDANIESVMNLEKNLQSYGKTLADLPHIIQANKRDLDDIISIEEINSLLNHHGAVVTEAAASEGKGVMETLTEIVRLVMRGLKDQFDSGMQEVPAPPPPTEKAFREAEGTGTSQEQLTEPVPEQVAEEPLEGTPAEEPEDKVEDEPEDEQQREEDGPDLEREIAMDPSLEEVGIPEPSPETAGSEVELAENGQPDEKRGAPVKLLVPIEDVGTLELNINISARVLKDGEIRSVDIDTVNIAADRPEGGPVQDKAVPAAPEQSVTVPHESPSSVEAQTALDSQGADILLDGAEPEPLSPEEAAPDPTSLGNDLPPLGENTGEPLGAPLDGQEPESFDIPDLPQEEDKIILDEEEPVAAKDVKDAMEEVHAPVVSSDYDPSVQPLDLDFSDTTTQEATPKKKGLFGRLGKKK